MTITEKNSAPRRMVATFNGRVQGVGFRFTTVEIARGFEITGFVQNMMDGSVKVVAEGLEEELLGFLNCLRESHIFRYVTSEDLLWLKPTGDLNSFVIRYA